MILVVGDAMIDRYWHGTVTRISPEAPVPVLRMGWSEERPGGALNVLRNVEAMGAECRSVFSPSYATRPVVKLRLIGRTQQIGRVDWDEPQEPVEPSEVEAAAHGCRFALLSDYAKGALSESRRIIDICKAMGLFVAVDPKGRDASRYAGADVIKPNHYEMEALVGEWRSEDELQNLAFDLCRRHDIGSVLMTRGEQGMTLFRDGTASHVSGTRLDLCDVSGAGDTALAAFGVALLRGCDAERAMRYANHAAGIAVGRFGTAVVSEAEVFG